MSEQKDISMLDLSEALDNIAESDRQQADPPARRKSTLILTDEKECEKMQVELDFSSSSGQHTPHNPQTPTDPAHAECAPEQSSAPQQQPQPQQQPHPQQLPVPDPSITINHDIKWVQGGTKVYVTGSFTGWRKMIGLQKQPDGTHVVTLDLPVGTHRFRFVIDNELRFSDFLPTATDEMGNFVNYVEITPENVQTHLSQKLQLEQEQQSERERQQRSLSSRGRVGHGRADSSFGLTNDDDDMGNGYLRYYDDEGDLGVKRYHYINDIPPIFVEPKVMEQYYLAIDELARSKNGKQQAWLHPPQLPPHFENVILNNFNMMDTDNNSGALPIPIHVVLNHLATTSIKHNTLAVASVVRYKRKYMTQVLYAPLQQ